MTEKRAKVYHGDISTFMGSKWLDDINDLPQNAVAVMGVPFDYTSGSRPGARWGPRSIRQSSQYVDYFLASSSDSVFVDVGTGEKFQFGKELNIFDLGDLEIYPTDLGRTKNSIISGVQTVCEKNCFPMLLGGDHFITVPAFYGFVEGRRILKKDLSIGYIHLDSHCDIFSEHPAWGKEYHGSTVRRIAESKLVKKKNILLVGQNGKLGLESWEYIHDNQIQLLPLDALRGKGFKNILEKAMKEFIKNIDIIYLSIDIDSVAGAFAPGTGGISLDGMTSMEFLQAMDVLASFPVEGLDLVEVAPNYDESERTQRLASEALFTFLLRKGIFSK